LAADALALSGIDAYYGDSHVLHDVSFALGAGRVLALLGRNGAGKSTCMSAIVGWLAKRRAQAAGSLSGGEQQMLAIGRSLMGNPRVVLMDEPSEGLAPLVVAEVGLTIARLKEEGQAIVLVEQNLRLALDLADDVAILNTGRVVFRGTVDEVRADEALVARHLGVTGATP